MTDQARKAARAELVTRLFVVVLLLVLGALVVTIFQIRSTQLEGTPLGKRLAASSTRILDCTDTKGDCYARNQKETAAILSSAQRIIIISAACSANVSTAQTIDQRIAAITSCVTDRLAKGQP